MFFMTREMLLIVDTIYIRSVKNVYLYFILSSAGSGTRENGY